MSLETTENTGDVEAAALSGLHRTPFVTQVTKFAIGLSLLFALGCGNYAGNVAGDPSGGDDLPATAEEAIEIAAFGTAVYPLLREQCSECHDGRNEGIPSLASEDPEESWWHVSRRDLVDLDDPNDSRLVHRLTQDRHNCWENCMSNGLEILSSIVTWKATIDIMEAEGSDEGIGLTVEQPDTIIREASSVLTQVTLDRPTTDGGVAPLSFYNDAPDRFAIGTTIVQWVVTDSEGDQETVNQLVTLRDTTPPVVFPPPAIIANSTGPTTFVPLGIASANDLISGWIDVTTDSPVAFPVGTTPVNWFATDDAGNSAFATQYVTVREIQGSALMIVAPLAVSREAVGLRTFPPLGFPTASGGTPPLTIDHDAPSDGFALGDTIVRWTVRDSKDNVLVATQQVRIVDTTPPSITAPADVAGQASGDRTQVSLGTPTTSDFVDVSVSFSNDAPAAGFVAGETTVTWTALDDSGNTATDTQSVTLAPIDLEMTPPAYRFVEASGVRTIVSLGQPSATGGIPPHSFTNDAPADGFTLGNHTVRWTVEDGRGETASADQNVTVTDTTPPLVTAPQDVVVQSETAPVAVAIGTAQAADLSGSQVTITSDAPSGFLFGITVVVWTATDSSGNVAVANQHVTVSNAAVPEGDPAAGEAAYAANCQSCHGADISVNVSNIQNGATSAGIDNALNTVNAMAGLASLRDDLQTIADIAAYIADYENIDPPGGGVCEIDEDDMQPGHLQRLSKLQYTNTLRDLLHRQLGSSNANNIFDSLADELDAIPDDHSEESFRNFDQSTSADHMEGLLNTAYALAGEVVESDSMLIDFVGDSCATNASDRGCREDFVEEFGALVLRHPLSQDDIDFYADAPEYRELITALLMAPGFLTLEQYRGIEDPDDSDRTVLSGYELASKLSYHFWQTMPDAALFDDAATGDIVTDYEAVVNRVFSDSRTRAAMPEFFGGWLRLDEIPEFDTSKPELQNFLTADYGNGTDLPANLNLVAFRQAAIDEVLALTDYTTFVQNGDLDDLFNSTDSFATDPMLARAYGVATWQGGNSQPIPFDASEPRSGILSRAALQMYGDFNSHPILKGVRIRTELLCDEIEAPADVSAPEEAIIHPNFSTRELTSAITEIAGTPCAGCHEPFINPVGFPSENFDAFGRHRTEEILFDDDGDEYYRAAVETDTVPLIDIDSPDAVSNVVQLGELIAENPKATDCFVRHYYRFTQRRMEEVSTDRCELDALEDALDSDGLQGMLKETALLPEFKLRMMPN